MRHSKFFTVFLLSAITIMISIAFVFWGIAPPENSTKNFIAVIEDEKITIASYAWSGHLDGLPGSHRCA